MHQLNAAFDAPTQMEAIHRRDAVCRRWATTQAALVACLLRDWHQSVACFRWLVQLPNWSLRCLRMTSLLERVNRPFRAASVFHSEAGLLACVARVFFPFCAI